MAQARPKASASLVPPADGPVAERVWLRRRFQAEFDADAGQVAAVLSQTPGLRAGPDLGELVLDLVAVRLYLRGNSTALAEAARAGRSGPHVPLGRCVAAGLARLPSYRGAAGLVVPGAAAAAGFYRRHAAVTEWSLLDAWIEHGPAQSGDLEVRIWCSSARRTALLEPGVAGRVVFLPGTAFRVLSVTDGPTSVVALREVVRSAGTDGAAETDGAARTDGTNAFDELAVAGLARAAELDRPRADTTVRAGAAPGVTWVEVPR